MHTANPTQLEGFFSALGWQIEKMPINEDAAEFWGVRAALEASACVAPTQSCEVLLLPVSGATSPSPDGLSRHHPRRPLRCEYADLG